MKPLSILVVLVTAFMTSGAVAEPDILIADFEDRNYGDWTVTGEAFGPRPARGTLRGQMEVTGFEGDRLVNSFHDGDNSTGTLTSPPFTIKRHYINFLIGGGGHEGETCINLLRDGEVVRTATGPNTKPGGSEALSWHAWDVRDLAGQEVVIQIVDARTGGWGHVNIDHIVQSDEKYRSERVIAFVAEKRYVNLPVQQDAPKIWVRLLRDEEILREFDIELAPAKDETDFWVTLDVSEFAGQELTLRSENVPRSNDGFRLITQADEIIGAEKLYQEKYRPQFHFSPKRGWNNDPNGMMYYDGEYHLFFQHNPYGWNWGNMTWGHAVSTDLVHWQELGDAIHPDERGTIFSGSGVVDWKNTTGFQTGDEPPLVCIFTYAGGITPWSKEAKFTQGLAYSNDRGRTWTKYEGNPVLGHINGGNRDPKVIWHEPTDQWVIVLYLDDHRMGFFTSKNLKEWTPTSELECFHECPELFTLPVDGDAKHAPWILYGAAGDYFIGEFDGKTYTPQTEALPFNYGDCFYASQTFSDIPPEDGRRIQMAWGRTGHKDMPFNQMMNFPVTLNLRTTEAGPRLFAWPVQEIETLYTKTHTHEDLELRGEPHAVPGLSGGLYDVLVEFEPGDAETVGIHACGLEIDYDTKMQTLKCKKKSAPLAPFDGKVSLRLLVDRLSVEIFANNGRIYMPMSHVAEAEKGITLFAEGGTATVEQLTVHELASAW